MKEGRKTILIVVLLLAISQLMQAGFLYYAVKTDMFKGDKGNQGLSIKGDTGDQGIQGNPGIGIKGDKGDKGNKGDTGARGSTGSSGKDAPVNNPPAVLNASFDGYYFEGIHHKTWFVFNITTNISDSDDNGIYLTFNYRENQSDPWTEHVTYIATNGGGTYHDTLRFNYYCPPTNKTIYWGISLWDGSDITFEEYEYTVYAVFPI